MSTISPPLLTYHYLTHHIVPGPQGFSYFVPLIILHVALLVPRSTLSRWQSICLFMPVVAGCTAHAWWEMGGVDVISVDKLLWALLLLVLRDPWEDFRRVGQKGALGNPADSEESTKLATLTDASRPKDVLEEEPYPPSLWPRLSWVGVLIVSIRLNNWKINSPSHDRNQPPPPAFNSRTAFTMHALLCFTRGYLILDLTRAYVSYDPYFTDATVRIQSPLPFESLQLLPPQFLRSMVIGAQAWALLSQMFYLPCLLPVGLNALGWLPDEWSPHNWPTYFGSSQAIFRHGVRGFWGQYWHQTMRWSVSGPGYAIADALQLRSRGMLRYAIISVVAFGLSGVVHMGLVPPEPLHATMSSNSIRLYIAGFFWLQPLAMLAELLVARLFTRMTDFRYWQQGLGLDTRRVISGVWVIIWFTLALPLFGEAGRQLGYWRVWPFSFSVWKALTGEGWIAWPVLQGRHD